MYVFTFTIHLRLNPFAFRNPNYMKKQPLSSKAFLASFLDFDTFCRIQTASHLVYVDYKIRANLL